MGERPELRLIEFSCNLFSRTVMEKICDALAGTKDLEQQVRLIQDVIGREIPYARDAYAQLRHAKAILESVLPEIDRVLRPRDEHPIWVSVLCELGFLGLLRQGKQPLDLVKQCRGLLELAALCRALLRSPATPPLAELLDRSGESPYLDALIRDLLREKRHLLEPNTIGRELALRMRAEAPGSERWLLFGQLLAENGVPALDPQELEEPLLAVNTDPLTRTVLLRIGGGCGYQTFLPTVHRLLRDSWITSSFPHSPKILMSCLDVLAQIGNGDSLGIVDALCAEEMNRQGGIHIELLRQYAAAVGQGLRERLDSRKQAGDRQGFSGPLEGDVGSRSDKPVLVQVVLNANPQSGGSSSVGGVLTFLHSIGDALAAEGSLSRIITLEVLPWNVVDSSTLLFSPGGNGHAILRVPVYTLPDASAEQLMVQESGIRRAVALALSIRGIEPDLFHVRYTDNLAKAMLVLAGELGSRLVFTLTADPHRDFADAAGELLPMSQEQALFNLNKVFIADTILEKASGILGIAHGSVDAQLLTYFPKLCLSPQIQHKPVRVIPEGIRLEAAEFDTTEVEAAEAEVTEYASAEQDLLLSLLIDHPGTFRLDRRFLDRPVILNVGRLVASKGQQRLVQAWAQSPLNEEYNLVLIGGNLEAPDPAEAKMLAAIRSTLEHDPRLVGRFCHLAALDNVQVRRLESALAQRVSERVQVYLCSSFKEEFGISILEAMAAGFLALAPLRGGVPTYVEHGASGFLIDTTTAASIRRAAEQILLSESPQRLQQIAAEGQRFILDNFGIQKIAGRFAAFYRNVLEDRSEMKSDEL
ncbi:MAG: glycosyltransferase family 4 protein [Spirochaetaceae bacterium]|nr:MAG: glycosyltransferase family 4 protein [Spirochaetaceae bacterium]